MRTLRLYMLVVLLITLAAPGLIAAQGPGEFPPDVADALQTALDKQVAITGVPGTVLLLDSPQARFAGASGYANLETQTLLQPDAAFQIGSITKMFTSVVMLQLAEEGVLSLDDPLSQWLPEIAASLRYGDQITLRQLLNHTAGVYNYTDSQELVERYLADPQQAGTPQEIIDAVIDLNRASFEPGTNWSYSNTGYILLGMVIEQAADIPAAQAIRERILEPLGMAHTYMEDIELPTSEPVHGYSKLTGDQTDVTDYNMAWAWTAGALVSTPSDLARFIRALFAGELFSDPDSLTQMQDTAASKSARYGLGMVNTTTPLGTLWGHDGGTVGYSSVLLYEPERDQVIVMLTNTADAAPNLITIVLPAIRYLNAQD